MSGAWTKFFQVWADFQQGNPLAIEYIKLLGGKAALFCIFLGLVWAGARIFKGPAEPAFDIPWGIKAVTEVFIIFIAFQAIAIYFKQPLADGGNLEGIVAVWSMIEYVFLFALIWVMTRFAFGRGLAAVGWISGRRMEDVAVTARGMIFIVMLAILTHFLYWTEILQRSSKIIQSVSLQELLSGGLLSGLQIVLVLLVSPVCEETFYRGFMYPVFRNRLSGLAAAIILSLFFAAVHFDARNFVLLFFMSFVATVSYDRCRWIGAPIVVHAFYNALVLKGIFSY